MDANFGYAISSVATVLAGIILTWAWRTGSKVFKERMDETRDMATQVGQKMDSLSVAVRAHQDADRDIFAAHAERISVLEGAVGTLTTIAASLVTKEPKT